VPRLSLAILLSAAGWLGCAVVGDPVGSPRSAVTPTALRCQDLVEPLGLDVLAPRLSWQLVATDGERGARQTACRVRVASRRESDGADLWDSGEVATPQPWLLYGGQPLRRAQECWWTVAVRDQHGTWSLPSTVARWGMGLLSEADWRGAWIGAAQTDPKVATPDPWLRTRFTLPAPPVRATAWVTSIGFHEVWVNGRKVGDAALAPAISDLSQRALAVAYDLTPQLRQGDNAVVLWAAAGWAAFPPFQVPNAPLVRARIDVECADGSVQQIVTDGSWRVADSPTRRVGSWRVWDFGGERIDARNQQLDFATTNCDDRAWTQATAYAPKVAIRAAALEPDRALTELTPQRIEQLPSGAWRVDLGRAVTGFFAAKLRGAPGQVVTLSFSEREDQPMSYNQRSELVLGTDGTGTFRNRFNVFTGRWVTITGSERPEDVRAQLVRGGFAATSEFECSDPLLQRIHDTTVWTLECLAQHGMLVDCPHRERCGYGGDAHATVRTALTHFGMAAFYRKWLADWRDVQQPDGDLPFTAPTRIGGGGPAWSGICVQLPWELYCATGDRRALSDNWPMMTRWLEFLRGHVREGLLRKHGHPEWGFLGDWVPPGRGQGPSERVDERTTLFFNNAYWLLCVRRAAQIASVLGQPAAALEDEAEAIRAAVHQEFFVADTASYANGEQPYLALALLAEVPPLELRPKVLARLVHAIQEKGHLDAGIHGHRFVLDALTAANRPDLVALMARRTGWPGWGWMLEQGATTIWEQWDGKESRLHSSFLGIGAWFVEGLAGIRLDPARPGGEHVVIRPGVESGVRSARARWDMGRGPVESDWVVDEGWLTLRVVVPPGVSATVLLPAAGDVQEGGRPAGEAVGVTPIGEGALFVESGSYEFRAELPEPLPGTAMW
jgi:alpha-L-rhamnosidase